MVDKKRDYHPEKDVKHYTDNVIQEYEINTKENKISLKGKYKVTLDLEFEDMCYSSSDNEC